MAGEKELCGCLGSLHAMQGSCKNAAFMSQHTCWSGLFSPAAASESATCLKGASPHTVSNPLNSMFTKQGFRKSFLLSVFLFYSV